MAKLLKLRRGTDTQHSTFTGAEGEVTVNTTNDSLHVHDGTTAGGREVARADLSNVSGATTGGNITIGGNLSLQDSNKILVGTGDDLQLFHNNQHSYIKEEGTGELRLGTNNLVRVTKHDSETLATFGADGACELFHDNSAKLATTSTGIDVTGTVTCDGLTVEGDQLVIDGNPKVSLKDSNNTGNGCVTTLEFQDSANTVQGQIGYLDSGNSSVYLKNSTSSGGIVFGTNNTARAVIQSDGHFRPDVNNTYDLGTSTHQWRNGYFDGTVHCDGLTSEGNVNINVGSGGIFLKDTNSTGNASTVYIDAKDSNSSTKWQIGTLSTSNQDVYIKNIVNGQIRFNTSNSDRIFVTSAGHLVPNGGNTYDLGDSTNRWRNVYTNDLNLSNEGGTNDVDGTWGSWTIQEGEDDLFLLNRRNGKKYKFNLSEVN